MAKKRVPIYGAARQFVDVDPEATKGATLGRDLYGPDGTLLTAAQIINQGSAGAAPQQRTGWKQILEIPPNIQKLAALDGVGHAVRRVDGEWALRTIQPGEGIDVENGSGDAGNPSIGLAELEDTGAAGQLVKIDRDAYGRVAGTESATTSDLPEGTNLYFTEERAQDAVGSILVGDDTIEVAYDDTAPEITVALTDAYRELIDSSVRPTNPPTDGDVLEFDATNGVWVAKKDPRELLIDGGNF